MMFRRTAFEAACLGLWIMAGANGQPPHADSPKALRVGKPGVSLNDARAFQGYTLIAPMNSTRAHLIDMEGRVVHSWECDSTPALSSYLLENGRLLRPGTLGKGGLGLAGAGGRVQEYDWDGRVLWDYRLTAKNQYLHHDVTRLPNGNILMIVGDRKTKEEAIAAGRRPEAARKGLNADAIIEVKATGDRRKSGEVVWEWHAWDHMVQDFDKSRANFGKVAAHPERIDINYGRSTFGKRDDADKKMDGLDKLKGLGYLGGPAAAAPAVNLSADWTHINAVAYNAEFDQVLVSVNSFSEVWIIDHSTTTQEAASTSGGRHKKGGDLLYRWGNPQAYRAGSNADQRLFQVHNAHWIDAGLPGAGRIIVFNNGVGRLDGSYSSVDEIVPPVTGNGAYERKTGMAFGPSKAVWSYSAAARSEFFAPLISGAQRLPNGNTLICSGTNGTVFEVTPEKKIVWQYVIPSTGFGRPTAKSNDDNEKGADLGPGGLFRSYRYGTDHPAFRGRVLTPGKKLEDL